MLLRLLLMNTCNFCFNSLVSLQVSAPYKSTAFTFDPKTLNLVLVVSAVDHHIGLSIASACLAFSNACLDVFVCSYLLAHNTPEIPELVHLLYLQSSRHYPIWYQHALALSLWH